MDLEKIKKEFLEKIEKVKSVEDVKSLKVEFLGKKSEINSLMKSISTIPQSTSYPNLNWVILESILERNGLATKPTTFSLEVLGIYSLPDFWIKMDQSGAVDTVNNIFDVAWYRASQKPGEGGTSLLNAHNGGPTKTGVFGKLYTLPIGSIVTLERGDGEIFNYKITENQIMPLAEANNYMGKMLRSPEPGKESVSLISCAGRYSTSMRTFMDRAMLRGILVERGSEEDQEATKKVKANEKFKSGKLKNSKSKKSSKNK